MERATTVYRVKIVPEDDRGMIGYATFVRCSKHSWASCGRKPRGLNDDERRPAGKPLVTLSYRLAENIDKCGVSSLPVEPDHTDYLESSP